MDKGGGGGDVECVGPGCVGEESRFCSRGWFIRRWVQGWVVRRMVGGILDYTSALPLLLSRALGWLVHATGLRHPLSVRGRLVYGICICMYVCMYMYIHITS